MPTILRIKRSDVSGNPAVLAQGELAYSALTDNGSNGGDRLYIGMGTETAGNAVNHIVVGGKRYTDMVDAATNANTASTIVKRDASGNFSAGTITATLTGNASSATTAATWTTARDLSLTGDATATLTAVNGSANVSATLTLANSGVTAGSYGSASAVPVITVDAKGRVTSVTTAATSSSLSIAGGTGTDTVIVGTDTLTFAGGTGVTTTVTNNQVSFAIGQAVGTSDNVSFNNVTVNGTLTSDDITSANISIAGNATITGNLTVNGTTTTVNSTTTTLDDPIMTLGGDTAPSVDDNKDRGIEFRWHDGTNAKLGFFGFDDSTGYFTFIPDATNTSEVFSGTKGTLDITSITGSAATWTTARDLSLTGDATATLTAVNGSANVSATLTLANSGVTAGSYGTSTSVPAITVDAKGRVTSISTNSIPTATTTVLGLASFDSTQFTVTSGAVSISTVDGGTY